MIQREMVKIAGVCREERIERDERKDKKGRLMILIGGEEMSNNEQSFKRAPNVRR
jgi:hypothetical protein